jgi:hypothetical protein
VAGSSDEHGAFAYGSFRRLTFDMSGGPKGAKRPLGRPLDGGVSLQLTHGRANDQPMMLRMSRT